MHQEPLSKRDIESLYGRAKLFRELLEAGVINEAEHCALMETSWNDAAGNRAAALARQDAHPFSTSTAALAEEPYMNPKSIIESIEQDRAVMEACHKRLNRVSPHFPVATPDSIDSSSLLAHTVHAHLSNTAEMLHQLAEIEAETRRSFQTTGSQGDSTVIDGEAVVINNEHESSE